MEKEITEIYFKCQDWDSKCIRRLIGILEELAEDKEDYEKEKGL